MTTLPAIICVLALIIAAWCLRRQYPAIALAVLFYFAGQLVESTSIPLELYFEHRNYVPALLMCWPLGLWLSDTIQLSLVKRGLSVMLPICLAVMTHVRAEVWGNVEAQAAIWAHINPDSPRAQTNAAQLELKNGHPFEAASRLEALLRTRPDQAQLALNLVGARCITGGLHAGDMAYVQKAIQTATNSSPLFVSWFEHALPVALSEKCPGFSIAELQSLIDAGIANPKLQEPGPQQDFMYLRGSVALAQHRPELALRDFIQALNLQVRPDMALQTAATLGAAGYPAEGLKLLDYYQQSSERNIRPSQGMPMLHEWVLTRENYWPNEIAHLRRQLTLDAKAHSTNTYQPQ
jgi:tetratricopeptide (TPR) repeat protein